MMPKPGYAAIALLLVVFAALHLGFSHSEAGLKVTVTNLIGGFAFLLMTVSIALSTRARFLEDAFGGLDEVYRAHKYCGVVAGVLVLLHFFTSPKGPTDAVLQADLVPSSPLGMLAMIALIISLAITLNRKIAYHKWRLPHKAMGLVYLMVCVHVITAPTGFFDQFGPSGLLIMLSGAIGLLAYIYSTFGMNRTTGVQYLVEEVHKHERATELVLRPKHAPMRHKAGQFAFVEIQADGLDEPHPFTISSSSENDRLRFTIKVLGDWTRKVREAAEVGMDVVVRGPYGRFCPAEAGPKQVWLAGGIGVTPFLSQIRSGGALTDKEIYLVYGVRDRSEALFLDELKAELDERPASKLILLESNKGDFARVDVMKEKLGKALSEFDYFLCGPTAMVKGISADLKAEGVAKSRIHSEAFEFR